MIKSNDGKHACRTAEVIRVIHTNVTIGKGTPEDPIRLVQQYWSLEGILLAFWDELSERENLDE
ncbi:hypothetical protein LCGC14_2167770 [marine sediment metagenome]|uniref:Uncharacterized protein n=1 Tax=marine sediment metagenome TaxID=412755 RepID=A0A0F9GLX2_9ZZZZ